MQETTRLHRPPARRSRRQPARNSPAEVERLVRENLPLAKHLARKIGRQNSVWPAHEDTLLSAAHLGLVCAARLYDESTGWQFSTYAYYAIVNAVLDELKRLPLVRYPARIPYAARRSVLSLSFDRGCFTDCGEMEPLDREPDPANAVEALDDDPVRQQIEMCFALVHDPDDACVLASRLVFGLTVGQIALRRGETHKVTWERLRRARAEIRKVNYRAISRHLASCL